MSMVRPCLTRSVAGGEVRSIRLGHPLLDDYLEFVGRAGSSEYARWPRPTT